MIVSHVHALNTHRRHSYVKIRCFFILFFLLSFILRLQLHVIWASSSYSHLFVVLLFFYALLSLILSCFIKIFVMFGLYVTWCCTKIGKNLFLRFLEVLSVFGSFIYVREFIWNFCWIKESFKIDFIAILNFDEENFSRLLEIWFFHTNPILQNL